MHDQGVDQPPPYSTVGGYPKAPYPTGGAPYPTGGAPYPTGGAPYPTGGAPYPTGGARYPTDGASHNVVVSDGGDIHGEQRQFTSNAFGEKAIRRAFIRKVYLILTVQLLFTTSVVALFISNDSIKKWVRINSWFYWMSYAVFLITYITLICCGNVRRQSPGNFIALSIFTAAFTYMTATISSFYSIPSVLIALSITAVLCLAITLFAIQTRIDFTMCTSLLFVLSIVLICTGFACMIVGFTSGAGKVLYAVYGGLAALVFGLYLVYDTQSIIGGRKYELSPEDYVVGALQLYLDVVNIFLIILSLFGQRD